MKWNKYTIETTTAAEDYMSAMLADLGIEGVEIEDNIPLSKEDQADMFIDFLPELPPDDGVSHVSFYLEDDGEDRTELLKQVKEALEDLRKVVDVGSGVITSDQTEDLDWINNWKKFFSSFYIDDILIKPTWEELKPEDADKFLIEIDPGVSFGTGKHETTQLCIRQLLKYILGTIDRIAENVVEVCITEETALDTELPCRICLFQGLPKSDKMELIVQKAVELGAAEVIPVAMKNCVVKLDAKKAAAKTARWQEIAKSAAKQSKRSRIPVVREPVNYREAVALAGELDVVLLPYENERGMAATREVMERIAPGQSVGIFIGPEGGFDPSEIALAKEEGMHLVSLGKRILRTETAGLATLSILMYHIESVSEAEEERDQP